MTTYTSSTGKSSITDRVSGGYSCEMTIPNKASDRNKEFQVLLIDCLVMRKRIAELEKELADANECLTIAYMQGFSDGKLKGGE